MTVAVCPGTFDPVTKGHADLVARAARLFPRVLVAVAADTAKSTVFNLEQRLALAQEVFSGMDGVEVMAFSGLLVDFCRSQDARVVIRGLRTGADFDAEAQLARMNRRLAADVETLFLTSAEQFAPVSSSLVREIAQLGGDVSEFVHPAVLRALRNENC